MMNRRTLIALTVLLVFAGNLMGSDPQDLQRELEMELMAPCCYKGPVAEHGSDAAKQVKVQIAGLIAEGKTRDEILDMYVAIYGEKILSSPKPTGFNMMAYFMPPVFLLLGGLLVIYFINRQITPAVQPAKVKEATYSDEFFKKIEQEMKELNI